MEGVKRRDGLYGFEFLEPDERRVDSSDRKNYQIKSLWQRHHEIINLTIRGMKQVDIAEFLNIHPQTVSDVLNSQLAKMKISEIRKEKDEDAKKFHEKITRLTDKALNQYNKMFDDESGEVSVEQKRRVAENVLMELSGLRSPTRVQSENISYRLTPEEFQAFLERGRKAAEAVGEPIVIPEELREE